MITRRIYQGYSICKEPQGEMSWTIVKLSKR